MRNDIVIKEYVKQLSDDDIRYIISKLYTRLGCDLADLSHYLSRDKEVDKFLLSASSCQEWFNMIDVLESESKKEIRIRDESRKAALV